MAQDADRLEERAGAGDVSGRRWLILGVVCLAQLMVVLDATVVNIALPTAQHDLGFSNADRQWVVTAYSLAFGALLLLGGRLSDSALASYLLVHGHSPVAIAGGAVHSYVVAFWVSAGIFAGSAVVCGLVLRPGVLSRTITEPAETAEATALVPALPA